MNLPKLQQSPSQMSILKKVVLLFFILFVFLQVMCIVEFYCLMAPTVLLVLQWGNVWWLCWFYGTSIRRRCWGGKHRQTKHFSRMEDLST
jgi:predicted membrane channel-forming protein YqfA (hemolysin III family)